MVLTISSTKPAARGLELAPTRDHSSSAISAKRSAPAFIIRSFATSVAPENARQDQVVGHPSGVQHDVLVVVEVDVVALAHGGGGAGHIPGQHHRQVLVSGYPTAPCPVRKDRHGLERPAFICNGGVIEADAIPAGSTPPGEESSRLLSSSLRSRFWRNTR